MRTSTGNASHRNDIEKIFVGYEELDTGMSTGGLASIFCCKEGVHVKELVDMFILKHTVICDKVLRQVSSGRMYPVLGIDIKCSLGCIHQVRGINFLWIWAEVALATITSKSTSDRSIDSGSSVIAWWWDLASMGNHKQLLRQWRLHISRLSHAYRYTIPAHWCRHNHSFPQND